MAKTEKSLLLRKVEGFEDVDMKRTALMNWEEEDDEVKEESGRRGRRPRKRAGERGIAALL